MFLFSSEYDDDFFENEDTSDDIVVDDLLKPLNSGIDDSSNRWSVLSAVGSF